MLLVNNLLERSTQRAPDKTALICDQGRMTYAEIDAAAWSTLYATVSRPFDPPSTGKIAVKVINHYGDEVLKVYEPEVIS